MELNWKNHIHSDSNILLGKPVIKDTRLSIEFILSLYAKGWSEKMILDNYPALTKDNLKAVFLYLQECLSQELYFPIKKAI